MTDVNNDG